MSGFDFAYFRLERVAGAALEEGATQKIRTVATVNALFTHGASPELLLSCISHDFF